MLPFFLFSKIVINCLDNEENVSNMKENKSEIGSIKNVERF